VRKLITVLSLFFLTFVISFGQFKRQREYSGFFDTYYYRGPITFTLGAGMTNYRGDLTKGLGLNGLSYGLSAGANYKIWPHIVLGAEFSYLNLQSTDYNKSRNGSFNATAMELQVYGRLYIIDEIIRVAPDRRKESHYTFCKPYLQAGLGGMLFTSTYKYNSGKEYTVETEFAPILPVGFGLQFTITQRSSLCAEYIYRFTLTDLIDYTTYNGSGNDGYGFMQLKFQYAPTAPKRKKKMSLPPPTQYDGPKGTETWKTKKQEEQKNRPAPQEYEIPENNTDEETVPEDEVIEEVAPEEETPAE
jgi:hypothetical protein